MVSSDLSVWTGTFDNAHNDPFEHCRARLHLQTQPFKVSSPFPSIAAFASSHLASVQSACSPHSPNLHNTPHCHHPSSPCPSHYRVLLLLAQAGFPLDQRASLGFSVSRLLNNAGVLQVVAIGPNKAERKRANKHGAERHGLWG